MDTQTITLIWVSEMIAAVGFVTGYCTYKLVRLAAKEGLTS